jgi:two-component system phosphate regulon sensor histidine kinase PhoR
MTTHRDSRTHRGPRREKRHDSMRFSPQVSSRQESSDNVTGKWSIIGRVALGLTAVFAVFSLAYWIAYWIAVYLYQWIGYRPGQYLTQMTTLVVAFVLLITGGLILGRFAEPKRQAFMQALIDATRQMAKGNFNVRIDVGMVQEPGGQDHPFRQLVHSINDMAQELAQMEQMRQEFISNVSHEIQSPLTAIAGFVQALKSDDLPPDQRLHYLNIIETESKRLSRLSDNLLKLTSLESGHHPFHPERYRLDRQIRDVVLSCEPLWMQKEIQLDVSLPAVYIIADKDLLSQVWMNLLTNAIKFTEREGSIVMSLQTQDRWAVVRITDTGIGIAKEDQPRIFERFYKADKARNRSKSGSGLGLAIVKKIIDIHHGEIHVESRLGVGTTFIVQLPLEPQHSTNDLRR